ncbi:hypothetical protein ACFXPJ_11970 [Streptomyces goshikiensis]
MAGNAYSATAYVSFAFGQSNAYRSSASRSFWSTDRPQRLVLGSAGTAGEEHPCDRLGRGEGGRLVAPGSR